MACNAKAWSVVPEFLVVPTSMVETREVASNVSLNILTPDLLVRHHCEARLRADLQP